MIRITIDKRKFNKDMRAFQKVVQNAFKSSFSDGGDQVVRDAKFLSSDVPSISNSISINKNADGFEVTTGNGLQHPEITAYEEFGTGNYAAALVPGMPQDWQDMARKYFINGLGTLPARPYLYPSFLKFKENIDQVIINKINGVS